MATHRSLGFVEIGTALCVLGATLLPGRPARAQALVLDVTNLVQNIVTAVQQTLSVAEEVEIAANQGTQISQQLDQLQHELDMLQNMAINTRPAGTVAWGEAASALGALAQAIDLGLSIPYAMTNVAAVFERRFPGYVPPSDWPTSYDRWSTSALDTLRGTLASAGRNVADAPSVQAALDSLRRSNDNAQGRLEAIQIGNQLASLQIAEVAKLRQLTAAQINAQNAYLGAQEAKAAGSAAAFDRWVGNAPRAIPVARPSEGLGAVPHP